MEINVKNRLKIGGLELSLSEVAGRARSGKQLAQN